MDSLVEIYKSMELASGVNIFLSQAPPSMGKKGLEDKRDLEEPIANKPPGAKRKKQGLSKVGAVKSINESPEAHKVVAPSFFKKKRIQISPHPRRRNSESPMASDDILKLDCNGSNGGLGNLSYRKSSGGGEDISDVGREEYQPATSRGTDGFDQERNVTLSPFFWLKEQDDDDETDGQDRDQQLEMDHVTDTPTYAMPAFSDLKDSEDGSPEKCEVNSRFEHGNLFDSEMFEWTQRPGSPELHYMFARAQGTEQPSSVEKEQRDAPDHVRNQICEQELYATEKGRLNFEFTQSVNTADSGSGLLTRSQKSSTSKTKSRRVRGCTKTTKKGSVNGNGDATLIMGGGPGQLIDEKEGNEHLLGHAHIHHETVVNLDPKAHGNMELNNVHHLEDVNGETLDPAKKANKKVRKPNKKNTQAYIVGEDNTKTRTHGSNDIRSDERLDDIPRKFAVEKLSCDPSESLEEIRDSAKDQMCKRENGNMDELLPAIDLPNPEKNEINAFNGNSSESNVKHCTRKKWKRWQISRTQTCTVSVRENNPGHSPTERICESLLGTTDPPDNRKGQISGVDAHTVDEEGDHQCSREETRSRTSNSSSIINQVNSCKQKKRKGSDVSTVCSDLVPVLEEIFDGSNKVVRVPKISGNSRCLQDKDANSPAKAVEGIAGKDLMLQRCERKSPSLCCIFCHSLDEKEVCGEMLHFANGRIVSSDYNGGSAVVHAHRNCVEWAPDVYFDNETVINLEKEVARSKRIRCTDCGIKGAALGCYEKSCRKSYHVPCAKSIAECRWDMENFVMLCPLHYSLQLPKEKEQSVPQKRRIRKATQMKIMRFQPTNSTPWRWTFGTPPKWVLCCSALGNQEKEFVSKFCRVAGLHISKTWCASVTHVIASTDENGACRRTLKVLMGILEGKWILNIKWVKACLEIMEPVDERPFEITRDIHGCSNGPQRGRMRVMQTEPKLFNGFRFYFSGDFASSYKGYLQDLIVAAGGAVLHRKPVASATQETFVLYNVEVPEKCSPSEASSSVVESRRKEAEALARASGAHAVGHSWVLDSIVACSLLPFT
ncbi:BREAST CANCER SUSCEPTIBILITY 1-like protein [Nymphaea thermarum]|nr:BREAST CANCER SUSCEPTIBILITY 1-like protein [Nymphaea thermarum]